MKKAIVAILLICCLAVLAGCSNDYVREYKGTPLASLTYEQVDFHGGSTKTYVFDFQNNVAKLRNTVPDDESQGQSDFEILKEFSETEEKQLIDKLYTRGLFGIAKTYKTLLPVIDGGGWTLEIAYSDGKTKQSTGINSAPNKIFNNCAKAFYDLLGDGVVGYVPMEYYCPPNVSYNFQVENANYGYTSFGIRLDYSWNGFESLGNDAYTANLNAEFDLDFLANGDCTLGLYTSNYKNFSNNPKFSKCTVTGCDFNENLTNKTTVYSSGWFNQISIDLQPNKIYIVRLDFSNGDFVEYTFNTRTK